MAFHHRLLVCALLAAGSAADAGAPPRAPGAVRVALPDYGAELRAFRDPIASPVPWHRHVVNAGFGEGRGGPERKGGWLDEHWQLMDYIDRSGDYVSHDWLRCRGIWHEVYGSNEYQETIHFHEEGARELFWDNGIARNMLGERTLSPQYNTSHEWWKEKVGWDAFIVCNNAPRWSAVINYDLLTSPLFGDATSQDNIGGPTSRIGAGAHGRYCDHCNRKFRHYLETTGRLPEFLRDYTHIRDYVGERLLDLMKTLPPYGTKDRFQPSEAVRIQELGDDQVMAEYTTFLHLSHMHNMMRYYRELKQVSRRLGKSFDVHGNMGGGFVGGTPYQIALADCVDTVWFESAGQSAYDLFKYGWHNAWGAFRFVLGRAMLRGTKPLMCMSKFHKKTPDLVAHELAEQCAGGAVLFVAQHAFAKDPDLLQLMQGFFELRHNHRAVFAPHRQRRHCRVAMLYSVPTMMHRNYMAAVACPPACAMAGFARGLEDAHIPFDMAILNHPAFRGDFVTSEDLSRYDLLILPVLECLSDTQIETIGRYLDAGGTVGFVGETGTRDEHNRLRNNRPVDDWRRRGRVVDLTPTPGFQAPRGRRADISRQATTDAAARVRAALSGDPVVAGGLPGTLWVKTWEHDCGVASFHFVNYDIDFESGRATPSGPVSLTVRLPVGVAAEEARFLVPGAEPVRVPLTAAARGRVSFRLPSVRVYGMVLIGKAGLDDDASAVALGDALRARASYACGGAWGTTRDQAAQAQALRDDPEGYAAATEALLAAVARRKQSGYAEEVQAMAETKGAVTALDFGGEEPVAPWQAVAPDSPYSAERGFGWLESTDNSAPTPEETWYAMASRHHRGIPSSIQRSPYLLFWPYTPAPPPAVRYSLCCGGPRRFRIDLPNGHYRVRVVTTMASWVLRNFLVSGMVSANGASVLLDVPRFKGGLASRSFTTEVEGGHLELTFGGPTGWAASAVVVGTADAPESDPLAIGGLRQWRISPRYPNPDWYPIAQTRTPVEDRLAAPDTVGWMELSTPRAGIPIVDLGANSETDVGDTVYALTTVQSDAARAARLHLGASSEAVAWLNGERVAYLPNVKGVERDEALVTVRLRPGPNALLLKLNRFWERRWQFYASLTE